MAVAALVLAGGGERVVAWERGVLAGLADAGLDAAAAERIVGTSAGALVGTLAALGVDPSPQRPPAPERPAPGGPMSEVFVELASIWSEAAELGTAEQRRRVGAFALASPTASEQDFLSLTAARVPPGDWPPALTIAAVEVTTGERVAFGRGDGVPVAAAVAASRAVPGVRPPITLLGRRYMDGAIGSATNADLAAGADRVVVVTPTPAEPPDGTLFAVWDVALRRELEGLRAGGAEVVAIRAGAEDLEAMGPDLMSGERAAAAFAAGRLRGRLLQ